MSPEVGGHPLQPPVVQAQPGRPRKARSREPDEPRKDTSQKQCTSSEAPNISQQQRASQDQATASQAPTTSHQQTSGSQPIRFK
ncbi:unnamed protein product [Ilex paraguariensis]|uniref:Uncharacterized protein n=1 Tax=Ilex paraguariensis TaxID=185542 RepID=A0ABC8TF85_9AQUA